MPRIPPELIGGQRIDQAMKIAMTANLVSCRHDGADGGRMPLRDPSGRWTKFGSEKWEEYYRERATMICKTAIARGLKVIWVGEPISLRPSYSDAMKFLNKIFEEAAASAGSVYLDTWSVASADTASVTTHPLLG